MRTIQDIVVYDAAGNPLNNLVQWDTDVMVYVKEADITTNDDMHFFNAGSEQAYVVLSEYADGALKAKIPNRLLWEPQAIIGYIKDESDGGDRCRYRFRINVIKKPVPSDTVYDGSKDYIDIEEVLEECREQAKAAKASADTATEKAKAASDSAAAAKSDAAKAAQSAKEALASQTAAAASQKAAADSATKASNASTAASKAQTAAETAQKGAAAAQTAAETAKTQAEAAKTEATQQASAAKTSASEAKTAQTAAEAARDAAKTAQSAAESAKTEATTQAGKAAASAKEAETAQAAAETAKEGAETAQTATESAKTAALDAQKKAEAAQTGAQAARTEAEGFASDAEEKAAAAGQSQEAAGAAKDAAVKAQESAESAKTDAASQAAKAASSASAADTSAKAAAASQSKASASETAAKKAQTAAEAAQAAAETAKKSAETAKSGADSSAAAAKASADAAATSQTDAQNQATAAADSASKAAASQKEASDSAAQAAASESTATQKATEASGSASSAKASATEAEKWEKLSESYAHGGTESRDGEDTDNASYYYNQTKGIAQGLEGALRPMGTIAFSALSEKLSAATPGDMYNISDAFTSDDTFADGGNRSYGAGSNVYLTSDKKWDVLAGTVVSGVKGSAESTYRQGNVNLTAANVGAAAASHTHSATDVGALPSGTKYAGSDTAGGTANSAKKTVSKTYSLLPNGSDRNTYMDLNNSDTQYDIKRICVGARHKTKQPFFDVYSAENKVQSNNLYSTVFPPPASVITGTLPVAHGGTGNTTGTAEYLKVHPITADSDLNTYKTPGLYCCTQTKDAQTLTHCPTQNAFGMFVYQTNSTGQLICEYMTSSPKVYFRNLYMDTWGEWKRVYTQNDKPTADEIGAAAKSHTHNYAGSDTAGGKATSAAVADEATHAKSADTATTATKLGSETVGSTAKPIYLKAGAPTAIEKVAAASTADTATKATSATTATTATKLGSATVGSTTVPIYLNAGSPAQATGVVPNTRTVNGKALSANITLSATDVGAAASSHTHGNYVPTTRKVNSKALSADISLTASDVGAAATTHTHNYAGSASAGGAATSALKVANALTFTGGATGTYDGSAALSIRIPTGGTSGITSGITIEELFWGDCDDSASGIDFSEIDQSTETNGFDVSFTLLFEGYFSSNVFSSGNATYAFSVPVGVRISTGTCASGFTTVPLTFSPYSLISSDKFHSCLSPCTQDTLEVPFVVSKGTIKLSSTGGWPGNVKLEITGNPIHVTRILAIYKGA